MNINSIAGFFPEGPLTTIYGLVLLFSVISCLWLMVGRSGNVAGALAISWIVALTATHLNLLSVQVIGTAFCTLIAYYQRHLVGTLVAILFAPKIAIYLLHSEKMWIFASVENMWKASEIVAYLQVFVMILGGIIHGGHRILAYARGDSFRYLAALSLRMQRR